LQRLEPEVEDPWRLLLHGADVADGVLVESGARVVVVLHIVGEVADGLVDARNGVLDAVDVGGNGESLGVSKRFHVIDSFVVRPVCLVRRRTLMPTGFRRSRWRIPASPNRSPWP